MIEKKIIEDFLQTPAEEVSLNFSESEMSILSDNLKHANLSEIEWSNIFYWLTHCLSNAMKNNRFSSSFQMASILSQIGNQYPNLVINILSKTIETGEFKGQTGIFVLTDRFYGATFDSIFTPTLIAMNSFFSNLLEHDSKTFSSLMAKPIESGFTSGTNALLNLIYALKNAAGHDLNQKTTCLIADLLTKLIGHSPDILGFAITQEVSKGVFSGTRPLDLIVDTLTRCSIDNPEATKTISNLLLTVNEKQTQPLSASLTKIKQNGTHILYALTTALVSASYIKNNAEIVKNLAELIHEFFKKSRNQISLALTQPIMKGECKDENGIMHLVQALIISMDRNYDTAAITHLLREIIEYGELEFVKAFNSTAPSQSNHYLITSISKLENALNNEKTTPTQKDELDSILMKLFEKSHVNRRVP